MSLAGSCYYHIPRRRHFRGLHRRSGSDSVRRLRTGANRAGLSIAVYYFGKTTHALWNVQLSDCVWSQLQIWLIGKLPLVHRSARRVLAKNLSNMKGWDTAQTGHLLPRAAPFSLRFTNHKQLATVGYGALLLNCEDTDFRHIHSPMTSFFLIFLFNTPSMEQGQNRAGTDKNGG